MPEQDHAQNKEISLREIVMICRQNWGRIVIVWLAVMLLVLSVLAILRPKYTSSGAIYIEEKSDVSASALGGLMPLLGAGGENVESHKDLLCSSDLAITVINKLGLNAELTGPGMYLPSTPRSANQWLSRDVSAYANGIWVQAVEGELLGVRTYRIQFENGRKFSIYDVTSPDKVVQSALNKPVQIGGSQFILNGEHLDTPVAAGTDMTLKLTPASLLLEDFSKALDVSGGGGKIANRTSNVIKISYTAESPYVARNVVTGIISEFGRIKQGWATESSRALLEYVNSQVADLKNNLTRTSENLARYQSESGLISLEPQVEAQVTQLVESEVKLKEADVKLAEMENLLKNINKPNADAYLYAFMDDAVLQKLAGDLIDQSKEIAALESRFSSEYPPLKDRLEVRNKTQAQLKETLERYYERTQSDRAELSRVVDEYQAKFKKMPISARVLAEHMRTTQLYEELYLFLFKQQQNTQIAVASTTTDLHVVGQAILPLKVNFPKPLNSGLIAVALGAISAFAALILKTAMTNYYTDVTQIKNSFEQPVFAVVPGRGRRLRRASRETIDLKMQSPFLESIRQLRTNLLHSMAGKKSQIVMLTSSMPGEGKTTISVNLAATLCRSERVDRVLLIDCDMHKQSLADIFEQPVSPGLSEYLNSQASLEQIIRTVSLPDGREFDLICAGPTPPSPVELIESPGMQQLIDYAREHYSFTVLDAPPYPATTTALILAEQVNRILCVCRLKKTLRNGFRHHVDELQAVNRHVGLIVNSTGSHAAYGYGYGYGNESGQATGKIVTKMQSRQYAQK